MLEYGAKAEDPVISFDGRQSEVAAELQRGVCRAFRALGHSVVTELPLANGRRADVVAMSGRGDILIVEVKILPPRLSHRREMAGLSRVLRPALFRGAGGFPLRGHPGRGWAHPRRSLWRGTR